MKILENITTGYKRIATGIAIVLFLTVMYIALIPGGSVAANGVFSALSGAPIAGAFIKIVEWPQYNATTDGSGVYTMPNVPEGTYRISASNPGYFTNTSSVTVVGGSTVFKNFLLSVANNIFVPWTATTQGWITPFLIANIGNSNATVNISYYNSSNGLYVGNYSLVISPSSSKSVFRDWTTTTSDGSAVLRTDQPLSVVVNQFGGSLFAAFEVDPSGSNEIFLPYTAATGGWVTPILVVNRGLENAAINITYYYTNGSVAGNYSTEILSGASKSVFRDWTTASDGAAKVSSNQVISVVVDVFGPGNKFGAYTPASQISNQIFIPWTATTQSWTTPYNIVNRGSSSAVVNISYYSSVGGQLVGNDSVSIAPNAVVKVFRENSTGNGTDGSAILNSTQPISVIVQQYATNGMYEIYTPAMNASNNLVIPWTATTQGWITPFNIVNEGSATATVNISYYNAADGSYVGNYSVQIQAGASTTVFRDWTNSTTDGSAVLVSDQPITAVVNQFAGGTLFGAYTPLG